MAILVTIAQAALPAGTYTFSTPAAIGSALSLFTFRAQQVAWPLAGDVAATYWLDYSADNGSTWTQLSGGNVSDLAQGGTGGVPVGQFFHNANIPNAGSATRRLRIRITLLKTLTISGTLEAI